VSNSQRPSILTANPSQASRNEEPVKQVPALFKPKKAQPEYEYESEVHGTLANYPCDQWFDRLPLARPGELTAWFLDDEGELSGLLAYLRISDPHSWGKVMAFRRHGTGYLLGRWVVLEEQFDRLLVIPSRKVKPAKALDLIVLGSSSWIY